MTVMNVLPNSGPEYTTMAKAFFGNHHPLFNSFGVEIGQVGKGSAEMSMPFSGNLADHRGALHRGTLVTLLDTTCGLAIFSALGTLRPIATIDLRVDFLSRVPVGVGLRAVVECVGRTDTVAYIAGRGYADGSDEPVAMVSGSFAIDTMGPSFDALQEKATA
jgi:uncharacterized protein (TIGR00369 family)